MTIQIQRKREDARNPTGRETKKQQPLYPTVRAFLKATSPRCYSKSQQKKKLEAQRKASSRSTRMRETAIAFSKCAAANCSSSALRSALRNRLRCCLSAATRREKAGCEREQYKHNLCQLASAPRSVTQKLAVTYSPAGAPANPLLHRSCNEACICQREKNIPISMRSSGFLYESSLLSDEQTECECCRRRFGWTVLGRVASPGRMVVAAADTRGAGKADRDGSVESELHRAKGSLGNTSNGCRTRRSLTF